MEDLVRRILKSYDMDVRGVARMNGGKDAFKLTCGDDGDNYFLKIYGENNDYDIIPGERIYHTFEQVLIETDMLYALAGGSLTVPSPVKNIYGSFVTAVEAGGAGSLPVCAAVTSFIDGHNVDNTHAPTVEMAYSAGVSAALLHMESQKKLLPLAVKRPHRRRDYIGKILSRLERGRETGILTRAQYAMLSGCCGAIVDCMDGLDADPDTNVGLVHTDIINGNIVYTQNGAALIDFSRSVYSYYLYDLSEMCLHANFCGSSPDLQRAVIRGYNSVKPLDGDYMFTIQTLFVLFLLIIMAYGIDSGPDGWRDGVLKWFADEVHPGLMSGKGYLDPGIYANII